MSIFDPATVCDRATYAQPNAPSAGIVHVLVGGTCVVKDGCFVQGVFPGQDGRSCF